MFKRLLCIVALCVGSALACALGHAEENAPAESSPQATQSDQTDPSNPTDQAVESAPPAKDWISGRFTSETDNAWSDHSHDFDLDQSLRLKIDPTETPKLHLNGTFWLHEDLDGDGARNSALYDLDNAYDHNVRARISTLNMQVDDLWGNSKLILGRQRILQSPLYPRIDGAYFEQNNAHWDWYAFLGARASFYQSSHNGLSTGAGVAWRPGANTRLALDFAYLDENRDSGDGVTRGLRPWLFGFDYPREVATGLDSTYIAITLNQAITDNIWAYARFTSYGNSPNELILDVSGYAPGAELTYSVSYRRQMDRVEDQVNDLTVFYQPLGSLETYDHFLASVQKQFTPKFALGLEGEVHIGSGDKSYDNNRDYKRIAALIMLSNLAPGLNLSFSLERWDMDHGSGNWVVTGEMSKKWDKWTWKIGADYEQYRDEIYNYNAAPGMLNQAAILLLPGVYSRPITPLVWALDEQKVRTREEIHSFYTGLDYALCDNQKLSAKVSYEEDDTSESPYWRVQTSYAIDF